MKKLIAIAVSSCVLIFSCTPSKYLIYSEKTNDYSLTAKEDKILSVAMFKSQSLRANFETQLVLKFGENKISAETSLDIFPFAQFQQEMTKEEIENVVNEIKERGFNKILLTVLVDQDIHTELVSSGVDVAISGAGYYSGYPYNNNPYGNFEGYWGVYQPYYSSSSYTTVERTAYICESTLFDLNNEAKLDWVGKFKVEDPNDMEAGVEEYTSEMVEELIKLKKVDSEK